MPDDIPTEPAYLAGSTPHTRAGTPRQMQHVRRVEAAIGLRLSGASYDQIAVALGYLGGEYAMAAVENHLAKTVGSADRELARQMANMRYERLLLAVWPKAINPLDPEQLPAVREAKGILANITKMNGLDAPSEFTIHNPTMVEFEQVLGQLMRQAAPPDEVIVEEYDVLGVTDGGEPEYGPSALALSGGQAPGDADLLQSSTQVPPGPGAEVGGDAVDE